MDGNQFGRDLARGMTVLAVMILTVGLLVGFIIGWLLT
jgi:hypothetical protein